MVMVRMQVSLESLIEAIATLDLGVKRKLMEIIEDQIFESEEESMENDPEVLAEVEEARKAYQIGDYQTIQEYITNQSEQAS
ncbi:MAG: hypothetical protein ACK544_00920 [Microcystis sp.]|jgi:hypothetical protein|uniref:Uncharacterized protein n=4 Tax=Microcystaceae TaxID=1890449 RepID=A0A552F8A5_MICAE|nr:hypothetical protein [Microcystis wesenbergii FACHB-1317]MBE5228131.1 hypothetical protein [Microcystis aeruginosa PMC 728.11]MCU7242424.1 hypothetical protein [Microcystis aeruginosa WS75]NCR12916.1 hypothetical protein [Microcystis aeruginosa SX13-11]NCR17854.1 hypothetical protein [Microcystis aeruginosa LL13-03]NCR25581.1 hypothetical protein [Microcystis aeruginosa LE13-04]NCR43223.1 hypothetical protein [Microcystis aeruginosa SX13-01]NCR56536.1 hypothetical protein [Microcystis aer